MSITTNFNYPLLLKLHKIHKDNIKWLKEHEEQGDFSILWGHNDEVINIFPPVETVNI